MHPRSKLSQAQREWAVDLFEQGYGSQAVASRLGVKRDQVRRLENRFAATWQTMSGEQNNEETVLLRHEDGDPSPS